MEGLALELPEHVALRAAMARGFTQFAYGFVEADAQELPEGDARRKAIDARATRLLLRARDYGLEGLRLQRELTLEKLKSPARDQELQRAQKEDVELLYWTLAPWAASIALNKQNLDLIGDLPVIGAMLDRALQLDEAWDKGSLHELSLSFDPARPGGTRRDKQDAHFKRALELSDGLRQSLFVSYAENVLLQAQDKANFEKQLNAVVQFNLDDPKARDIRLANVLAQRRARLLLSRVSDLFLD
jgi:hypothetical protein